MKKRLFSAFCALCLTASLVSAAAAKSYSVNLTESQANAEVPILLDVPPQVPAGPGMEADTILVSSPAAHAAVEIKIKGDAKKADVMTVHASGTYDPVDETLSGAGSLYAVLPDKLSTLIVLEKPAFTDVSRSAWYYGGMAYVYHNGLMNGTGPKAFSPRAKVSRSMIATILWREAGEPRPAGTASFPDVPKGQFYTQAALWCAEKGIMDGKNGKFLPKDAPSREDLMVMLYRFCQVTGIQTGGEADLSKFSDAAKISPSAKRAVSWAVSKGLLAGNDKNQLMPQGTVNRDQLSVILMRFLG